MATRSLVVDMIAAAWKAESHHLEVPTLLI